MNKSMNNHQSSSACENSCMSVCSGCTACCSVYTGCTAVGLCVVGARLAVWYTLGAEELCFVFLCEIPDKAGLDEDYSNCVVWTTYG